MGPLFWPDVLGSLGSLFSCYSPIDVDVAFRRLLRDEVELRLADPEIVQFSCVVGTSVPTILDPLQRLFCKIGKGNPLQSIREEPVVSRDMLAVRTCTFAVFGGSSPACRC